MSAYTRRPVRAPRLSGWRLRALVGLLEQPLAEPVRRKLLRDSGFGELYGLDGHAPTLPPVLPLGPLAHPTEPPEGHEALLDHLSHRACPTRGHRAPRIADYADAYRAGRADPEQVAEAVLAATARGDEGDAPLRLFIAQDADDVRRQAAESAARLREGRPRSVLEGVPVAIKDEVDQVPYPTTVGRREGGPPATRDAETVARLRACGAVLVGKANMHEIGLGVTGLNPHHGVCRNPLDPSRHTGGSSSGSGAAVASGLVPLALGADGGGSIRIPAALCGQVGLKPTFGRVSERGAAPLCWSVGHLGPIAGSSVDCAVGYSILAGHDPEDPATHGQPPVHLDRFDEVDLSDLRLGVFRPWFEDADPDVVAACDQALDALRERGASIVEVSLPDVDLARIAHLAIIATEMRSSQEARLRADHRAYGLDVRTTLALAGSMRGAEYAAGLRLRHRYVEALAALLQEVDGLVTPATGCVAPVIDPSWLPHGGSDLPLLDKILRFSVLANLTGFPAIAFPVASTPCGLPASLQVIGRPWEEAGLLRVAHAMDGAFPRVAPAVDLSPLRV